MSPLLLLLLLLLLLDELEVAGAAAAAGAGAASGGGGSPRDDATTSGPARRAPDDPARRRRRRGNAGGATSASTGSTPRAWLNQDCTVAGSNALPWSCFFMGGVVLFFVCVSRTGAHVEKARSSMLHFAGSCPAAAACQFPKQTVQLFGSLKRVSRGESLATTQLRTHDTSHTTRTRNSELPDESASQPSPTISNHSPSPHSPCTMGNARIITVCHTMKIARN